MSYTEELDQCQKSEDRERMLAMMEEYHWRERSEHKKSTYAEVRRDFEEMIAELDAIDRDWGGDCDDD